MKFSYNWLRELVPGLAETPADLERLITIKTAECEGIEPVGAPDACLALVETVEPVPNTHVAKALVSTEIYGQKTLICGAPNCRPGLRTAYIPLGKKVIQGVESEGMLASPQELGIGRDHAGIIEMEGQTLPAADSIIDIDNKSLTHRPDLWGHYGMAREVAAITGNTLRDPVDITLLPAGPAAVTVQSAEPHLCPRLSALVFENVTVAPSPLWLQFRLTALGLNPINNVVDLTNFLMAELAQPTHAYDRALLNGGLIARLARDGERVMALNKEEYTLTASDMVIADQSGAVGIAGVMGGLHTSITAGTASIVLEAANFHGSSVRKTASTLKLRTDASMRFEKAQDPANTVRALARAIELMRELSPEARLVGGLADWAGPTTPLPTVALDLPWLARKLGREVPAPEVRHILESLGFTVSDSFHVTVPSWRATKDISVADDLVEEVGRMIGYASIEPRPPAVFTTVPPDAPERLYTRRLRSRCTGQGYTEVYNYSFLSEEQAAAFHFAPASLIRVLNPIAANQSLMRPSLLPGIYANVVENRKHLPNFRLFEIGKEIHKREAGLPDEIPHLTAAVYGSPDGLFELKRLAEAIGTAIHLEPCEARAYEHPRRAAQVLAGSEVVGRLFELHPHYIEGRAAILDLDLRALAPREHRPGKYTPLQRYPSSSFDLSIFAVPRALTSTLEREMASFAGPLLESVEYIGQYPKSDRKSVTFRFTLAAPDRTLSNDEVTAVRAAIIAGMRGLHYDLTV